MIALLLTILLLLMALSTAAALVFAAIVAVDMALSARYQRRERPHRHLDPDRVDAHMAWPWHEDPIELDRHRNGTGRSAEDVRKA